MICSGRLDPKVVFAYVQEVYRALKDYQAITPTQPSQLRSIGEQRWRQIPRQMQMCMVVQSFICLLDIFLSPVFILYSMILLCTICRRSAGIPDFLTADDMLGKYLQIMLMFLDIIRDLISGMVEDNRIDPKMVFSYVQEVYRMCNDLQSPLQYVYHAPSQIYCAINPNLTHYSRLITLSHVKVISGFSITSGLKYGSTKIERNA